MYGGLVQRLSARGWLNRTRAVALDEPGRDPFTQRAVVAVNRLFQRLGVSVLQTDDGSAFAEVASAVDSWTIKTDAYASWARTGASATAVIAAARQAGKEALVYNNAIAIVDLPAMRPRGYSWQIWSSDRNRTGLQGWGSEAGWYGTNLCIAGELNDWGSNPWRGNAPGHAAGFSSFGYPPRAGIDDPGQFVASIRWEMLRQGAQDRARFDLLQQLAGQHAVLARVRDVVWDFPATIQGLAPTTHDQPFSTNLTLMHAVLDDAADAITELLRTPVALVV